MERNRVKAEVIHPLVQGNFLPVEILMLRAYKAWSDSYRLI